MGTTLVNFQSVGNMPVIINLLKRSERLFDILEVIAFSILVEIPSAPVAFVEFREWMRSKTWSSLHRNSSGKLDESRVPISHVSLEVKLGTEWLKLRKNWLLSISAFGTSLMTRAELGTSRAGIKDSFSGEQLKQFPRCFRINRLKLLKEPEFCLS